MTFEETTCLCVRGLRLGLGLTDCGLALEYSELGLGTRGLGGHETIQIR